MTTWSAAAAWPEAGARAVVSLPLQVDRGASGSGVLCIEPARPARLAFAGEPAAQPLAKVGAADGGGRISVVYFGSPQSLADLVPLMADRYGHGNARWLGAWTWYVMAFLLVAALAAAALTIRRTRSSDAQAASVARAAALTALLVGTLWALLIPPFHVPDEISHLGYAQYVAETGKLPRADAGPGVLDRGAPAARRHGALRDGRPG